MSAEKFDERVTELSAQAEQRFAELEPERAKLVDRIISNYTFDTAADRARAHECCRAISGHPTLAASQ